MALSLAPRAVELQSALVALESGVQGFSDSGPGHSPDPETRAFAEAYREALALQERAANEPDALRRASLRAACEAYQRASALAGHGHVATLYNHGVALSDLARLDRQAAAAAAAAAGKPGGKAGARRGGDPAPPATEQTTDGAPPSPLLAAALDRYAAALRLDPTNPQALNNAGLVLQEMASAKADPGQVQALLSTAVARFREALRRRPDFHRAAYNAGTALYALAAARRGAGPGTAQPPNMAAARAAFSAAALYVALAAALRSGQGASEAYARSLETVAPMLPLPALRRGMAWYQVCVGAPGGHGLVDGTQEWTRGVLEVDARELRCAPRGGPDGAEVRLPARNVCGATRCADPSLPAGAAVWVALTESPLGRFLVFEDVDEAESWADALNTLAELGPEGRQRLEGILHARGAALAAGGSDAQ